jgi:hypothetical protein
VAYIGVLWTIGVLPSFPDLCPSGGLKHDASHGCGRAQYGEIAAIHRFSSREIGLRTKGQPRMMLTAVKNSIDLHPIAST